MWLETGLCGIRLSLLVFALQQVSCPCGSFLAAAAAVADRSGDLSCDLGSGREKKDIEVPECYRIEEKRWI